MKGTFPETPKRWTVTPHAKEVLGELSCGEHRRVSERLTELQEEASLKSSSSEHSTEILADLDHAIELAIYERGQLSRLVRHGSVRTIDSGKSNFAIPLMRDPETPFGGEGEKRDVPRTQHVVQLRLKRPGTKQRLVASQGIASGSPRLLFSAFSPVDPP